MKGKALAYKQPDSNAAVRLFCFPNAGGTAVLYRPWIGAFGKDVDVCPIEYPGRGTRSAENRHTDVKALVQTLLRDLFPYFDRPFAFFGHSMGALVSFELARTMRLFSNKLPMHLFLSAHRAPHLERRIHDTYKLDDAALTERVRELGGTPPEVLANTELMELMLPIIRDDFQLCDTYTCAEQTPLPCKITAIGGWQDKLVGEPELAPWAEHSSAEFNLQMFPGGHFYLQSQQIPVLQRIGRHLLAPTPT